MNKAVCQACKRMYGQVWVEHDENLWKYRGAVVCPWQLHSGHRMNGGDWHIWDAGLAQVRDPAQMWNGFVRLPVFCGREVEHTVLNQ